MQWHILKHSDRLSGWLLVWGTLANVCLWALALLLVPRPEQLLPLHYTIYFGIDLTGPRLRILLMPLIGLGILVAHLALSRFYDHPVWQRLWLLLALLLQILLTGALGALLYVIHQPT